ncbi:MAG: Ig-like domain-containing protein [Acidobacteriota bacterium]
MMIRYLFAFFVFPGLLSAQCNVAPVAADDTAIHRGAVVLVDVLANDSDGDGQALSATLIGGTCPGTATLDQGLLTWTPPGYQPSCTFTYRVFDEDGLSAAAVVTVSTPPTTVFYDNFESGDTTSWVFCTTSACP